MTSELSKCFETENICYVGGHFLPPKTLSKTKEEKLYSVLRTFETGSVKKK